MSINLLVRDVESTERRFDVDTRKVIETTHNLVEEAKKLGVKFLPMPEDYVLYEQGGKKVFLHASGSIALARIENGQFVHKYNGHKLDRVQFLTLADLKELCRVFGK